MKDGTAAFSITGTAEGIENGGKVTLSVSATGTFRTASNRVTALTWKQTDDREVGPVSPASKVEAVISVRPFMCESGFDRLETLAGQHQRFRSAGISLWVNTLDPVSHGGFTDSAALGDPDAVWGRLIEAGVSVIQTDEPEALKAYIRARLT